MPKSPENNPFTTVRVGDREVTVHASGGQVMIVDDRPAVEPQEVASDTADDQPTASDGTP